MKTFRSDLHIHTCLSPCADWEMSPIGIIEKCKEKKIDLIAVCDHNTTQNSEALISRGSLSGISVLPGFEICSIEEVHILAIFDSIENAYKMQEYIYDNLEGKNNPKIFGYQVISNMDDEVEGENDKFLLGAVGKSLHNISKKIHSLNGLAIPAHIDRKAFGLISQLGYIPDDISIDAIEMISDQIELKHSCNILNYKTIKSSDAHFKKDIGKNITVFKMKDVSVYEMRKALMGIDGRGIEIL